MVDMDTLLLFLLTVLHEPFMWTAGVMMLLVIALVIIRQSSRFVH